MLLSKKLKFLTWPVMPGLGWPLPPLQLHWIHFFLLLCAFLSWLPFISPKSNRYSVLALPPGVETEVLGPDPLCGCGLHHYRTSLCAAAQCPVLSSSPMGIQCYVEAILTHF